MDEIPLGVLFLALVVLLVVSAFFSGSETSMMAVNRYRLKSMAAAGNKGARLAIWLLARTDRLLAVILLGNNLVNAAAAALVTVIAFRLFGENELSLSLATLAVTFLILVFSEVTPKVIGASFADRITPVVSFVLVPLIRLLKPVVWFINLFVRTQLALLRLKIKEDVAGNAMGAEELRSVLAESGSLLPKVHRGILLNLLDLENLTVDDVMRPRQEIEAIDLDTDTETLIQQLLTSHHAHLPVYRHELNNVVGVVHVRRALSHFHAEAFDHEVFAEGLRAPYFIPSGTPLFTQLTQFQDNRQAMGLVVDEYGELLGLVTVEDVIEEIVGDFARVHPLRGPGWVAQDDGSYLVEGTASVRDLNRKLALDLPVEGARTLNGLILEHLEAMPEAGVSVKIAGHPIEIVQILGRKVKTARIKPRRTVNGGESAF